MAGDEPVGASWTDKILANKTTEEKLVETGEGVDDDEWVRIYNFLSVLLVLTIALKVQHNNVNFLFLQDD